MKTLAREKHAQNMARSKTREKGCVYYESATERLGGDASPCRGRLFIYPLDHCCLKTVAEGTERHTEKVLIIKGS